MKKDISPPEVTDVAVAVIPRQDAGEELWDTYLINLRDEPLENILITSQGYGSVEGVDKTTTVLRHFHQQLPAGDSIKIEPIQPSLFGITNEYWVSFNSNGQMLDKRYVFKANTIRREALSEVPVVARPGIVLQ
ncbi:hypothetical protein [Lewinella sp. JB7]|uniref:hypothetical protein n=1 Tax=Lewinella sp. JB7 TaxID=2962887 RepID=UPI0020C9E224|nr:hypothetical protein [Lewinella sp. JB7]MCP9235518.1 hypothetical protein [Lewinella sp. JB7]